MEAYIGQVGKRFWLIRVMDVAILCVRACFRCLALKQKLCHDSRIATVCRDMLGGWGLVHQTAMF